MSANKEIAKPEDVRDPFLTMVDKLAANPDINADTVEKILDAQIRVLDREARTEFYAAMSRVQGNIPTIVADAVNDQTKSMYAKLKTISKAIKPVYTAEGLSTSFWEGDAKREGDIRICGALRHRDGHIEDHYYVDLPRDMAGIKGNVNKTEIHGTGSTFTYGRRYLTCMMFDIAVGDDTDGNPPVDDTPINADQLIEIKDLLKETKSDVPAFLQWCHVDKVEDIPARHYQHVIKTLKEKRDEAA